MFIGTPENTHHTLLTYQFNGGGLLASNGPHLDLLERLNLRYLISAREHDYAVLSQHLEGPSADWFADPSEEGRAVDRQLRVVEDDDVSCVKNLLQFLVEAEIRPYR